MDVAQALQLARGATLGTTPQAVGAGTAYQAVAQAGGIAVQDAAMYLRNVSTICSTATGVGIAQLVAGDSNGAKVLAAVATTMPQATAQFAAIGTAAGAVVRAFPSE